MSFEFRGAQVIAALLAVAAITLSPAASPQAVAQFSVQSQQSLVAPDPEPSQSMLVNEFILNSQTGAIPQGRDLEITIAQIKARLLTPINSGFNKPGDPVTAVVSEPIKGDLGPIVPVGSFLQGSIEGYQEHGHMKKEGMLYVRFYRAYTPQGRIDLDLVIANKDGIIHPLHYRQPPTRKQVLRQLLMQSSHIAIPLAIGTGGMSLAITTGAGAVIGGVLADNHQYFRGAVRGAWDASGFSILDPLIFKGPQAVMPWGTLITLRLINPVSIPHNVCVAALKSAVPNQNPFGAAPFSYNLPTATGSRTVLSTAARLLPGNSAALQTWPAAVTTNRIAPEADNPLSEVDELLSQKNLAAAMGALDRAYARYPDDPRVLAKRNELIPMVTGRSPQQ